MEWCRAYRADHSQGLVDHQAGGNRAKLSKLQIEELQEKLHQYTPKELCGAKASTANGQFWTVEDLALVVRERYGVEYKSRTSYTSLLSLCGFSYQQTEKIFKSHSQTKVADFEGFSDVFYFSWGQAFHVPVFTYWLTTYSHI